MAAKATEISATEAGNQWLVSLTGQYGEIVAIKPLKMLRGLADYPKQSFWASLLNIGTPMELVVTRKHLLFFDPVFAPDARGTALSRNEVKGAYINLLDGSQLHVKTHQGLISCKVGWSMDAKPIWSVLKDLCFFR